MGKRAICKLHPTLHHPVQVPQIFLWGLWKGSKESKQNASPLNRDLYHRGNRKQKSMSKEGGNPLLDLHSDLSWFHMLSVCCWLMIPRHQRLSAMTHWLSSTGREGKWDRRVFFTRKSSDWSMPSSVPFLNWSVHFPSCCFDCTPEWSCPDFSPQWLWRVHGGKGHSFPCHQLDSNSSTLQNLLRCISQHCIHRLCIGATLLSPNRMMHTVVLWSGSRSWEHQHLRQKQGSHTDSSANNLTHGKGHESRHDENSCLEQ